MRAAPRWAASSAGRARSRPYRAGVHGWPAPDGQGRQQPEGEAERVQHGVARVAASVADHRCCAQVQDPASDHEGDVVAQGREGALIRPSSSRKSAPEGAAGTTPRPTSFVTATCRSARSSRRPRGLAGPRPPRWRPLAGSPSRRCRPMNLVSHRPRQSMSTGLEGLADGAGQVQGLKGRPALGPARTVGGHPLRPLRVALVCRVSRRHHENLGVLAQELLGIPALAAADAAEDQRRGHGAGTKRAGASKRAWRTLRRSARSSGPLAARVSPAVSSPRGRSQASEVVA